MKSIEPFFLNKSEASHYLHTLHEEFLAKQETIENKHPDFHSLLTENLRDPCPVSAIKAMSLRGNRGYYGKIDHVKIKNRAMFTKTALRTWFGIFYAPKILLAA